MDSVEVRAWDLRCRPDVSLTRPKRLPARDGSRAGPDQQPGSHGRWPYSYGDTPNSTASDRLVVWLLVLSGSRYQSWAWTTAAAPGFLAGFGHVGHQSALRSRANEPSHRPIVPTPVMVGVRTTGGTTHWKLVLLPHGLACWPLVPKKKRPSFWPSTVPAWSEKPLGALALGVPLAESSAWQPAADVPAVQ